MKKLIFGCAMLISGAIGFVRPFLSLSIREAALQSGSFLYGILMLLFLVLAVAGMVTAYLYSAGDKS